MPKYNKYVPKYNKDDAPNPELMSEKNYYYYCTAWCAVQINESYAYDWYQEAGNHGIIFA